jgi:MFS family permease
VSRLRTYLRTFTGFGREARLFLVVTLVTGAAISLYWINFNLYLSSLGVQPATIGIIATAASLAGVLVAFPASALSDRIGRRAVLAGGIALSAIALALLLVVTSVPALLLLSALYGAGQQALFVVQIPYMTENSRPEHRSELFALQFALTNVTNIAAAMLGGLVAALLATAGGFEPDGPATFRALILLMVAFLVAGLAIVASLRDDRPAPLHPRHLLAAGEPATFPVDRRRGSRASRFGLIVHDRAMFGKLLLPTLLIALGAGQVIPFLNLFVQVKFGLDLASLNVIFGLMSFGTVVAILLQPAIARRLGRLTSVVLVQGASIPFLVVLGFSPILWTVVLAMAVRNSLMNAGNPIFNAFAMDQVSAPERATLSAAMSLTWSLGWVIAGPWYSLLQATLGFEGGYTVNFLTIIGLYSLATTLYWTWFRDAEPRPAPQVATAR